MPLDGHSYLVARGWSGKGSGLRQGAISRPLAIPQKKTLSGLGKDRDEAFPFWDHLFTVAAKTIQVKVHKDDDSSDSEPSTSTTVLPTLSRTSTGILSNKRPLSGTPASSSGSTTPNVEASSSGKSSSLSLIGQAKRDAAKRNLYSRFFRGPVLGPDNDLTVEEINEVMSKLIPPVVPEASLPDDVSRASSVNIMEDKEGRAIEKEKKKRKREKEERKAKKWKDKGKEKELLQPTKPNDAVHPKERKRKRADVITDSQDAQMNDHKPKKKREREVDQDVKQENDTYVDVGRKDDQKRDKKKKKRESVVEGDVLAEGTAEHKSDADANAKAEKRRRKAEKTEKRRRKSAEAVLS